MEREPIPAIGSASETRSGVATSSLDDQRVRISSGDARKMGSSADREYRALTLSEHDRQSDEPFGRRRAARVPRLARNAPIARRRPNRDSTARPGQRRCAPD